MHREWPRRACAVAVLPSLAALAACGGPVEIESPELSASDEAACEAFLDDLPATLSDLEPVETEPAGAPGAAYGDPPIVITCGVDEPAGFAQGAPCESVDGVDWFVPAELYGEEPVDVVLTSAWSRPRVEVRIPADYWPVATAASTGVLSPLAKEHLEIVGSCEA